MLAKTAWRAYRRSSRDLPLVTALALAAVLGLAVAASGAGVTRAEPRAPAAKPSPKPPSLPPAKLLRGTGILRLGSSYGSASGYDRYQYVLVSRHEARRAARLPGTVLAYMSGTSIQEEWSTGVTYAEARANGWLLADASGAPVRNVRYEAFVADVGNPDYQRRFVANMAAFLERTKADGIFLDDVLADPLTMAGVYPAKYPNGEAWESAMVSFVRAVGGALKVRGYYVLANAGKFISDDSHSDTGAHVAAFWSRIAKGVSGLMNEHWLQAASDVERVRVLGSKWHQNWDGWQSLVAIAQGHGVDFFGLMYGSGANTRAMRYARASFLLDWNGRGGALIYHKTDDPQPYHPTWVKQLGLPLRPKFERAPGVWQRRYEQGMVLVNATEAPAAVQVLGRTYTVAGGDGLFVRGPRT